MGSHKFHGKDHDKYLDTPNSRLLYVDISRTDTYVEIGTITKPFKTVQAAINYAETLTPSYDNPIGIVCPPGKYTEQITVKYAGINLYGYGQYVTRFERAGTCLIIQDNGVDPEPWDMKVVGISFRSTTADYSVIVQGIAGTSLAGNELQFRDGNIGGTNAIHINLANYIDFQNNYISGAQLYEQVSGIWCEDSESAGAITVDWDNAGDKPASGSHYGINFVRHLPRGAVTLLNAGIIGEDLRPVENKASTHDNDSTVTGATVKDALDNLKSNLYSINAQVGTTYTLASSDLNKLITLENASPIIVTVENNATIPFAIGSRIDLVQKGAGKVTIAEGSGVTINSKGGNKSLNGQYVAVSLIKEDTDIWYLVGDLVA